MRKYIRAMFFGSGKTKMYLWTIVLVALASFACFGVVITGGSINFLYLGFGGLLFSITYSQLGVFKDVNIQMEDENKINTRIPKDKKATEDIYNENDKKQKFGKKIKELDDEKNELKRYNEDEVKKLFVQYKVKKESFLVLIDSSEKYRIKNCPSYVWSDKKYIYFLLLEKQPRTIAIPRSEIGGMRYEKGIIITNMEEYKKLKDTVFLYSLYKDLLPKYYRTVTNGLSTFKKNLFVIAEDIRITTKSAKGVMKATQCKLELNDKQLDKHRFDSYFEEVYKVKLLYQEEVLNQEEVKEQLSGILTRLAKHEEKIEVYQNTIFKLAQYQLISQEYAEYFLDYRHRLEQKKRKKR